MNKFESSPITIEFQHQSKNRLQENSHLIAGVSGGPDSMALLYLLHRFGINATAVHCNYGLRGKASDQDQELVEQVCSLWEIECITLRLDSPGPAEGNFQKWAREQRYQIFFDLKKELNADLITTAHHADDQIETILQRILRGSGLSSWKGMEVYENGLFRPLLAVSKQEIMQFIQEFNIPYRIDGSNEESTYARNFLRHNWFPELSRLFPGWQKNLIKVSDRAKEFDEMADEILRKISEHPHRMNRSGFLSLHESIKPVILHRFFEKSGKEISVSGSFLSELDSLEKLQTGSSIQISDNCFLIRDRDYFFIEESNPSEKKIELQLTTKEIEEGVEFDGSVFSSKTFEGRFDQGALLLDMDKVRFPVTVRRWIPGDEIQPLGMKGTQLVSDHLTNRKISSVKKTNSKVLVSFDGSISAVIFPHAIGDDQIGTVSESVKCDKSTETVLLIRKK
jgi:tRNA(Ile)-lysidine synthase